MNFTSTGLILSEKQLLKCLRVGLSEEAVDWDAPGVCVGGAQLLDSKQPEMHVSDLTCVWGRVKVPSGDRMGRRPLFFFHCFFPGGNHFPALPLPCHRSLISLRSFYTIFTGVLIFATSTRCFACFKGLGLRVQLLISLNLGADWYPPLWDADRSPQTLNYQKLLKIK